MQIKLFILTVFLLVTGIIKLAAQDIAGTLQQELPKLVLDGISSIHIISPEPIRYVDIATHQVVGDLPEVNILRLKHVRDSVQNYDQHSADLGVVTIIGESFIAQYRLRFCEDLSSQHAVASFEIMPEHTKSIAVMPELTTPELKRHALTLLTERNSVPIRKSSSYGMRAELGAVYTVGDLVLLDVTYYNNTNLSYDIDELRFKIEDRKITKATNVQSIEIKPIWQLYPHNTFKKKYRNIYVLKKTTFPDNKILHIELSEKQISGRTLTLKVKYKDILNADTF
ncbi:conjugative transposon protein TraN [Sphingobacterium bovistauri]|uniref:Conjugative transposon protein TraN n=1 Tax=Sphingobacterium bovistauri TaxID=2781959 RepID=A0ABS7Z7L8_9SPHI|nr:conjugative transposon protein TraN [Sphingobacterium bovistauri]MCA5006154.1 conjugative transposon protein TraN [Sphingobacterium bovistauri]